ncbi:MAG: B12-binding domain-containing radical SAM protein [Nitrososphaerota archaeon]|nr:B12-binding domain-containing radical SAM protein [Nitrososphaerota archaeon]
MARYVLISDTTLSHSYRDFPLLDFLPSAPSDQLPNFIYNYLKGKTPRDDDGRASFAPYALRKIESSLLLRYEARDVVVANEDSIEQFINEDTELIGVSTMDPFGLGPLTMSYSVLFQTDAPAFVYKEFQRLLRRINRAREKKKAKLVVGGPGVWELTVRPEETKNLNIDYAFQGEADDVVCDLFQYLGGDFSESSEFYRGFQTFDSSFRKRGVGGNDRFITRHQFSRQFPKLEDIPPIVNPSVKGMVEVMRGCGVGCDFCEVTLRPLRYCSPKQVRKEIEVNVKAGIHHAWLHSDEIFAYEHGRNYVPNEEALSDLFKVVMQTKGVASTNPTHGRISIPAAYPELLKKISGIIKAGPDNWIGLQVGVETGSDRLARMHMPNKTLPLKIGPDGSWKDIVWRGTYVMNKYYWRPAFTVQVGQNGESEEDNWETVALINRMSNSELDDGRPFEFTITPMQNVPLGLIKRRGFAGTQLLSESQLAVYYASYRHLEKLARRNALSDAKGNPFSRLGTAFLIGSGGWAMLRVVSAMCKKAGLDVDKAARHGLDEKLPQAPSLLPAGHL